MRHFVWLILFLLPAVVHARTVTIETVLVKQGEALLRPAVEIDPVERAIVAGSWMPPTRDPAGNDWVPFTADDEGWIQADELIRGYAYAEVEVESAGTWLLSAMGYAGVYVNGEPRIGNIYGYTDAWESWQPHFDFSQLPVRLKAGTNRFLFFGNRYGLMRARLTEIESPLGLNPRDTTLPDLVVGEALDSWGALVVYNATAEVITDAELEVGVEGGAKTRAPVPSLPPYGVRKVGFPLEAPAFAESGPRILRVDLSRAGESFGGVELALQVKEPAENRRVTFVSGIDGSVQYYGFLPASDPDGDKALFLSLHGASVEAINQSGSYVPLGWGHLVAPTNRRPFGFSWEDWGRLDALEVFDKARDRLEIAADRVYLTGHSMGGHGSWQLASLFPDQFAAVGPSAGWISLWSYRQSPPPGEASPLTAMVERGTLSSETLELAPNLAGMGVYVLHGTDDDNVPIDQAHLMLDKLREFHHDVVVHEQPGVGHWWDLSDDPGADCVSWPPMFDFFARHRRPASAEVRAVDFRTPNPAISAVNHWVTIARQESPFVMSRVELARDEDWRRVSGTTWNVSLLGLDLGRTRGESVLVALDGDILTVPIPGAGRVWLARGDSWHPVTEPGHAQKGPHNYGGFRSVFDNRTQLVYATGGTPGENAWARAKARYDAEYLWYQGNSSLDVVPDHMYDPAAEPDRDVVLYGNAETHLHWSVLWEAPLAVGNDGVDFAGRSPSGGDLGVLAVYPRPGSAVANVGIVAPTGAEGARLLLRRPGLRLGVAYPDVTVFRNRDGDSVVLGAGYFGNDWSASSGEFVWEEDR